VKNKNIKNRSQVTTSQDPPGILSAWFLAIRPKTLTAAVVPVVVGTALAFGVHGSVQLGLSFLALISALLIQIGTNFINDSLDFKKGADTAERIGPERATQSGRLRANQVLGGGLLCFFLAAALALPLVYSGGWPIFAIGVFSLVAGYAYTGGPFPLAYRGFGDLFVLVFFGWVAISGVYYLNTGVFELNALIAGSQIGLLATVLIAINNLRDNMTDRKANKRTLAVRWGVKFAKIEITMLCLAPFLGAFFWFQQGLRWAAFLPLLVFPLALALVEKVRATEPSAIYNRFLAQGALLHLGFGAFLSLGFILK
jgi:1,4-dihydroxy-2-naphthoate octaprenyltransferase